MTDEESIQQSVDAFNNLSGDNITRLKGLNTKIQDHTGKWGVAKGGEKTESGSTEMQWVEKAPLIYEFLDFMDDKNLLPFFAWSDWDEGSDLFVSENPAKYDDIDVATALKLIYAAVRKDRFGEGTLVRAFESGGFTKLVNRLVELKTAEG
jgi:hypothetical protein